MDFVVGLSLTSHRHNVILVIVDKLTKSAHFIPVRDTYDVTDVALTMSLTWHLRCH